MKSSLSKKHSLRLITLALCGTAILASCEKADNQGIAVTANVAGYLYTTTNGEGINQIIKFSRHENGSLTNETAYLTNSKGGANVAAGGDAHGDFDSQGAVQIIGKHLLAVNAGGQSSICFRLR